MAKSKCHELPAYPSHRLEGWKEGTYGMTCAHAILIAAVQGACANPKFSSSQKAAKYAYDVAIRVMGRVDVSPSEEIEEKIKASEDISG